MYTYNIVSKKDGLNLELGIFEALEPKGIVVFSHGMSEHKERYYPFMEFLSKHGYVCVIHDHRGHGKSVKCKEDLGYFYTEDISYIVDDLYQVCEWIKEKYALPMYLFSHSMGTLVARCFIQKYDGIIDKLVLCGPPTKNPLDKFANGLAHVLKPFYKYNKPNKLLDKLSFMGFGETWLSKSEKNRNLYFEDDLCGFVFTTNGFINLYQLMISAFDQKAYRMNHRDLEIFLIGGELDPVIGGEKKFNDLIGFLKSLGYSNVLGKLYPGLYHEILNEDEYLDVYTDVLHFLESTYE